MKREKEESWVYMLRCRNGALYTGWTNDLAARLRAHQQGRGARYTRAFGAQGLAYAQPLADKSEGLRREAALKKLSRAQKEALCRAWQAQGAAAPGFGAGQEVFGPMPGPKEKQEEKG